MQNLKTLSLVVPALAMLTGCLPDVPERTIIHAGKAYVFPIGYASTWTSGGQAAGGVSFVGHDPKGLLPFYDLAVAHDHLDPSSRDLGSGRLVECPSDGYLHSCEMVVMVDGARWSLKLSGAGRRADSLDAPKYDRISRMAVGMVRDAARRGASMSSDEIARLEHGIVHGCDLGPC